MIYKCTKTGAVVTSDSQLLGSWELVETAKKAPRKTTKTEVADDTGETSS